MFPLPFFLSSFVVHFFLSYGIVARKGGNLIWKELFVNSDWQVDFPRMLVDFCVYVLDSGRIDQKFQLRYLHAYKDLSFLR